MLGDGVHPTEVADFYESHTPYEWQLQRARKQIRDEQQALPAAFAAREIIRAVLASCGHVMSDDEERAYLLRLMNPTTEEPEQEVSPDMMRRAMGEQ